MLLLCLLTPAGTHAQAQQGKLRIQGVVSTEGRRLEDVTVRVFHENQVIDTMYTPVVGRFSYDLDLNGYYGLEFSKEGFIPKRFIFDTHTPDTSQYYHPFKIEVGLLPEKNDYTRKEIDLDFPISIVRYKQEKEDFDYVKDYTYSRLDEQEKMINEYLQKDGKR